MTEPTAQPEPIRKGLMPCIPPPEWEFSTVFGARTSTDGCALFPGDAGPVVVRRRVSYGDWEPVRPDHWAPEPPSDALDAPRSAVQAADGPAEPRHAHDGAQAAQGGPPHDFDRDPAALAWARAKIQHYTDRLAGFEQQAASKGDEASVHCFRLVQSHVRSYFLGDGGCVIGAFDQRRPAHLAAIQAASDGPSVKECAEADRVWPLQKVGE